LGWLLGVLLLAWPATAAACWTVHVVSIERVVDGDTFVADLQIFPKLTVTERVRVLDVDTPERTDPVAWEKARQFTDQWLKESGLTEVRTCKYDAFGRLLGTVTSRTKGDLAAALIAAGLGKPYEK
jgi:endonuclease YncB( thermonuclease family)